MWAHFAQFCIEAHVAGINHVGDEGQLIQITLTDNIVVLPRQLYALLLSGQLHEALFVECMGLLHGVVGLLGDSILRLYGGSVFGFGLTQLMAVF